MRVGGHGGHPGISGGRLLVQFLAGAGRTRLQHGSDLVRSGTAWGDLRSVQLHQLFHVGVVPALAVAVRQAERIREPSRDDALQVVGPVEAWAEMLQPAIDFTRSARRLLYDLRPKNRTIRGLPAPVPGRNAWRWTFGGCGRPMTDSVRRFDLETAVASGDDSPVVVMDLLVAVPAEEGHVGDVGGPAFGDGSHMMVIAQRRVGSASAAASVAADERLVLGGGRASLGDAAPQRHAVGSVEQGGDGGPAHELLEDAPR